MSVRFDGTAGLVLVSAVLEGPAGPIALQLALDTACHQTLINPSVLWAAGYGHADIVPGGMIITASGTAPGRRVRVAGLTALGHEVRDHPVLVHQLPTNVNRDGLLGLDFLRGRVLTVDFVRGLVSLT